MLLTQNLSATTFLNPPLITTTTTTTINLSLPLRTSLSLLRSLFHHHHRRRLLYPLPNKTHQGFRPVRTVNCLSTSVEQVEGERFRFEDEDGGGLLGSMERDFKHLDVSEEVEVRELEELPEQWKRARLAWLCKELPAHKTGTLVRILNGQRKWMRQEDATYVVVHCTRIRENEAAFQVFKWMQQQSWYRFDFALATKLADYLGKERKFAKCRKIFDDILNQGRVPSESTFHILIVAYLSTPVQGCLEEACSIYNKMIQLGGYQPRLSLHNSLFRALLSKPGGTAKHYLKQAEFVYHNLVTSGLEVQRDIYSGLIWLHSYQDATDKDRIILLTEEMKQAGMQEDTEVLLSVLRACSNNGDVEEAERAWIKLLDIDDHLPSQSFVYRMEVFAKAGQPIKSLEIFREMEKHVGTCSSAAYHKIIEVMCKANEMNVAEQLMQDFIVSGMNPLTPSFVDLTNMYLNLNMYDKLESAFSICLKKCRLNRSVYNIYLESLLRVAKIEKAEAIFNHMCSDDMVGVNSKSCNTILRGYLSSGDHVKADNVYNLMCQKKFDVDSSLMEKLEFVLSLRRKAVKKPVSLKLSKEQREILMGLVLGGMKIESDEERKKHMIPFEFNENSDTHSVLRRHLYDQYHEWLHPSCKPRDENEDVPYRFATISHSYFGFFADQFWPRGRPVIPRLIHRWLSPRVLAYWYMYEGYKTSSGDILLKVKGSSEGVGRIVKAFKAMSLECRMKKKDRVYWIGFLGTNSTWLWKLIEPFVLEDLKDYLKADGQTTDNYSAETREDVNFDSGSDFVENASEHSDVDSS